MIRNVESITVMHSHYGPPADLITLKQDIAARRVVLPGQLERSGATPWRIRKISPSEPLARLRRRREPVDRLAFCARFGIYRVR